MPFAQLRHGLHFLILALRQHLCRFHGTQKVAAVDRVKPVVRRIERHCQCLRPTDLIERYVGMSLNAFFDVPVGFPVADDADAGTDRFGKVMHINARVRI